MTTENIKELNKELVKKEKEYAKSKMNVIEAKNKHSAIFSELIIMRKNFKESQKNIVSETKKTINELRKEWFYDTYEKKEIHNLLQMIRECVLKEGNRFECVGELSDTEILKAIHMSMNKEEIKIMMRRAKIGKLDIYRIVVPLDWYLRKIKNRKH